MLLNPMKAESNEVNVATIFVEKLPEKDERLSSYRHLIEKIDSSFSGHLRLFTRIEVIGLSQSELEVEHYQLFSTVGLDFVRSPLLLFKANRIICVTKDEWREVVQYTDQLSFLRIKYPYRYFDIRKTDFLLLYDTISEFSIEEISRRIKKDQFGYVIPISQSLDEVYNIETSLPTDKDVLSAIEPSNLIHQNILNLYNQQEIAAFQQNYYRANQKDEYSIVLLGQNTTKPQLGQHIFDSINFYLKQENWKERCFLFSLLEDSIWQIIYEVQNELSLNLQVFPENLLYRYQNEILIRPLENYAMLFLSKQDMRTLFSAFKSTDIHIRVIGQIKRQINHHLKIGSTLIKKEKSEKKRIFLQEINGSHLQKNDRLDMEKQFCKHLNKMFTKENLAKPYRLGVLAYDAKYTADELGLLNSLSQIEIVPLAFSIANKEKFENSIESIAKKIRNIDLVLIPDSFIPSEKCVPEHKILSALLEHSTMKQSIEKFILKNGKIIGIGVGNKALVECGLLPYGRYRAWGDEQGYYYLKKQNDSIVEKFDLPTNLWNLYAEKQLIQLSDDSDDTLSILVHISTNHSVLGVFDVQNEVAVEEKIIPIIHDFVCADMTKK